MMMMESHYTENIDSNIATISHGTHINSNLATISNAGTSTSTPFDQTPRFNLIPAEKVKDKVVAGEGGFGIVFKAHHEDWGVVAVKQLKAEHIQPKQINKLRKEAEKLAELSHRNVIQLYGVILENSNYAVVLEYMTHGALDQFLETYEVAADMKIRMAHQIILALNYLHTYEQPIIHRDLKASNVLVGDNLDVKISDFGLSEWRSYSIRTSQHRPARCGTVTHIPPESWENINRKPDIYFDVYSFGILLWEILTERRPFEGAQDAQISHCVSRGQRPSPDLIPDDAPPLMVTLMEKCWQQDPEDRPNFGELKEQLESNFIRNPTYEFEQKMNSVKISLLMQISTSLPSSVAGEQDLYSPQHMVNQVAPQEPKNNGHVRQLETARQTRIAGDADQCQDGREDMFNGLLMAPAPEPPTSTSQATALIADDTGHSGPASKYAASDNIPLTLTAAGMTTQEDTSSTNSSKSTDHPINVYNFTPEERAFGLQLPKNPLEKKPIGIPPMKAGGKEHKVYQLPKDPLKGREQEHGGKVYKVPLDNTRRPVPNKQFVNGHQVPPNSQPVPPSGQPVPPSGRVPDQGDVTTDSVPSKGSEKKDGGKDNKGGRKKHPNSNKNMFNPFGPDFMANFNFAGATHGVHHGSQGTTVFNVSNIEGLQIGDRNVMYIGTAPPNGKGHSAGKRKVVKSKITDSTALLDEDNMTLVAEHTGGEWRILGRRLGFSDGQLDAIDADFNIEGLREKIFQMCRQWKEQNGRKAQLKVLANALIDVGKGNVAAMLKSPPPS